MKSPVIYLLEVLFCSGLFLVVYRLLLVRRVAFHICRRYLVITTLLAVSIPLLNMPLYPAETIYYNQPLEVSLAETLSQGQAVIENVSVVGKDAEPVINIHWYDVIQVAVFCFYVAITVISFLIFANRVRAIRRLRRLSAITHCLEYDLAENDEIKSPFSFLRTIYIGNDYHRREREQILCHESWHVSCHHSVERIIMEIVRCLFWFNPFVWIACRHLTEVQEWEADREVLRNGYDVAEYRTVIFRQLFGYNPDVICGLNNSLTKNRFIMMTHFKEGKFTLVRLAAIVPIVAGMMMLCSFTTKSPSVIDTSDSIDMALKPNLSGAHTPLISSDGVFGRYGLRTHPVLGVERIHSGVDIPAAEGAPILAAFSGRVDSAAFVDNGSGNFVIITHDNGLSTRYAHLAEMLVNRGDYVKGGAKIGTVGKTGLATGSHLHFEMALNGKTFDPEQVFDFRNGIVRSVDVVNCSSDNKNDKRSCRIHVKADAFYVNDVATSLSDLGLVIKPDMQVVISCDRGIQMGRVTDLKQALRNINVLRISYVGADVKPVARPLSPLPSKDNSQIIKVVETATIDTNNKVTQAKDGDIRIARRNVFMILQSGDGTIMVSTMSGEKSEIVDIEHLKDLVKAFILNESNSDNLSEHENIEIELANGSKWIYPQSKGVITLHPSIEADYQLYVQLQNELSRAYDDVRNDVSMQKFGRPMSELGAVEQQMVMRAVPIRISEAAPHGISIRKR